MGIETFLNYRYDCVHFFIGIVGIPAPEELMLFIIANAKDNQLELQKVFQSRDAYWKIYLYKTNYRRKQKHRHTKRRCFYYLLNDSILSFFSFIFGTSGILL